MKTNKENKDGKVGGKYDYRSVQKNKRKINQKIKKNAVPKMMKKNYKKGNRYEKGYVTLRKDFFL